MSDPTGARQGREQSDEDSTKMSAEERERRFEESVARVKKNHAAAIKRLADR